MPENAGNRNRLHRIQYRRPFPLFGVLMLAAFAVFAFVLIPKYMRRDYRGEVIADLRMLREAQETYRTRISKYQAYGNFDELARAGLIPASSKLFVGCRDCDENSLWFGRNRRFQFEIQKNAAGTSYCIAAVSDSKSDRAFAVAPSGVIFEDDADKISCASSPQAKISAGTDK